MQSWYILIKDEWYKSIDARFAVLYLMMGYQVRLGKPVEEEKKIELVENVSTDHFP